jgi:membrane protease YdiL (CAAX protease family)
MTAQNSNKPRYRISFLSILPFLIITFIITWAVIGLYILMPERMTGLFGELSGNHPLFFLAVWAPAIAAISIVFIKSGFFGLKSFLSRILIWRVHFAWYLFLLIGMPVLFYLGAALNGSLFDNPFPLESLKTLPLIMLLSMIKGPIEEFGWRGFALPLMQRKFAPFWASIILGIIWGIWHIPAFLASGTQQSSWSFMPFFLGTITISVVITALFNSSKGSLFITALFHFQLMNPIWPDAMPYDTYLLMVVAIIIVVIKRKTMFTRIDSITEVVPS